MDDALIAAHGEEPKLMPVPAPARAVGLGPHPQGHEPQARAADYLRWSRGCGRRGPDLLLSSDFITGFPGETEEDFQATLALVEEVRFGAAYSFAYSPAPRHPAAERPQVDPEEAHDRLLRLQAVIARQQREAQEATVGCTVPVLFEKPGRMPGQMTGRSEHLMAVSVTGTESLRGAIHPVRVTAALTNSLAGEIAA
jgi:tRNA-2-methylthio-N6-dimethylallyladenosine synthase